MLLILLQNPLVEVTTEDAADALVKCIKKILEDYVRFIIDGLLPQAPTRSYREVREMCKFQKYLSIIADSRA